MISFFEPLLTFKGLILFLTVMLWSIVLHELAHFFYFRGIIGKKDITLRIFVEERIKYSKLRKLLKLPKGKRLRVLLGYPLDYSALKPDQQFSLYLYGVAAGSLPIIYALATMPLVIPFMVLIPYVVGCDSDVKNMIRTFKKSRQMPKEKTGIQLKEDVAVDKP